MRFGTLNSRLRAENTGIPRRKELKQFLKSRKTESCRNYLYYDPILSGSDLRYGHWKLWIYPSSRPTRRRNCLFYKQKAVILSVGTENLRNLTSKKRSYVV